MMIATMNRLRRLGHRPEGADHVPEDLWPALSVPMQLSRDEMTTLADLAAQTPRGSVIVEIGSYQGGSAAVLALGARRGESNPVYAIDPHRAFVGPKGGVYGPPDLAAAYAHLTRLKLGEQVFVVSLCGARAARAWDETPVGMLWIDGDHRYEAVRDDYRAWYPHVMAGGVIAFHDCHDPGPSRLLEEIAESGELSAGSRVDSLAWFRKQGS